MIAFRLHPSRGTTATTFALPSQQAGEDGPYPARCYYGACVQDSQCAFTPSVGSGGVIISIILGRDDGAGDRADVAEAPPATRLGGSPWSGCGCVVARPAPSGLRLCSTEPTLCRMLLEGGQSDPPPPSSCPNARPSPVRGSVLVVGPGTRSLAAQISNGAHISGWVRKAPCALLRVVTAR